MQSAMIVKSRIVRTLLARLNGNGINNYDDLVAHCEIVKSCGELHSLGLKYLNARELNEYKRIAYEYGGIVKQYYYSSIDEKPKDIVKRFANKHRDNEEDLQEYDSMLRDVFDTLARMGDYDSFITAMEWNRDSNKSFYADRRDVLIRHGIVSDIQDLLDGKIRMLIIEAPPGIGKSVCGEFFCVFKQALNEECRGLIGNANASLTGGFYNDILDMMTNTDDYRFSEIVNKRFKIITDAEDKAIFYNKKVREPNILCRSIEVGATGKIHLNREGFLYMDDVVKNAEQANNREYLEKLNMNFASTFYDRRENDEVPVLVIGTPWSLYDLIAYLKKMYGDKEWFRVNSIPCYTSDEKTNFDYRGSKYKSVEYWKDQIRIDDPVIASAKYLMRPMERANRPFEKVSYFRLEELQLRLEDSDEKPFICGACDVAVTEGGDNLAFGIGYVFQSDKTIYIPDLVYSNAGTDYTIPKIARKIFSHKVELTEFEEKEGAVSKKINYGIAETVRQKVDKLGFRTLIRQHSGAGLRSKGVRIDTYANEIRGESSMDDSWRILFLHPDDRRVNAEYNNAMRDLGLYSNASEMLGKQKDDFPDMLAMLMAYCVTGNKNKKVKSLKCKF